MNEIQHLTEQLLPANPQQRCKVSSKSPKHDRPICNVSVDYFGATTGLPYVVWENRLQCITAICDEYELTSRPAGVAFVTIDADMRKRIRDTQRLRDSELVCDAHWSLHIDRSFGYLVDVDGGLCMIDAPWTSCDATQRIDEDEKLRAEFLERVAAERKRNPDGVALPISKRTRADLYGELSRRRDLMFPEKSYAPIA